MNNFTRVWKAERATTGHDLDISVCGKCKAGGKAPHADTTLRCEPAVRTVSAEKVGSINRLDEKLHAAVAVIDCWMCRRSLVPLNHVEGRGERDISIKKQTAAAADVRDF